jgi:putative membrane protein
LIGFVIRTVVIAIAVAAVAYVYPEISYGGDVLTLVVVAVVLGLLNAFIKPLLTVLSVPINLLTFGLFGVAINAALLLLAAWLISTFDIVDAIDTFTVGGFPPDLSVTAIVAAVVGAIGISIVGAIVGMVVKD